MGESGREPLRGLYKPIPFDRIYYGSGAVKENLLSCLPAKESKAFIITGTSLATRTMLIQNVRDCLDGKCAGVFSNVRQHAPEVDLDLALEQILNHAAIDTIISIGGGSPIDSAKAISYRFNERKGHFMYHIAIPTTLSAAECAFTAGFTDANGLKTGVAHPQLAPQTILYDSSFAVATPSWLFLSTGIRALDHAVELIYHPTATEICRQMALTAVSDLFKFLPLYHSDPGDEEIITALQLAAFMSLSFLGTNVSGPLGLSHMLGYALGSPYGIPHGITSCLTLYRVVRLKAENYPDDAGRIARLAPSVGVVSFGKDRVDGIAISDAIADLVESIGLKTSLAKYHVGESQVKEIVMTATRQQEGTLYDQVTDLVVSIL